MAKVNPDRFCTTCGVQISSRPRRPGRTVCQPCGTRANAQTDEYRARHSEVMKAVHADPEVKRKMRKPKSAAQRKKMRESMLRRFALNPEMRAAISARKVIEYQDPERRRRHGRAVSAAMLADIPLEYRPMHRQHVDIDGLTSAESRRIIRDQIEHDARQFAKTGKLQQTKEK